jgi:hypothetical protein
MALLLAPLDTFFLSCCCRLRALCVTEIGELLLHRVIAQFKRAYKRNDKPITIAAAKFLAHLINQGVLHEVGVGARGGGGGGAGKGLGGCF